MRQVVTVPTRTPRPRQARRTREQRRAEVVPYDFRTPTRVSREHVRTLQVAFDTAARRLTTLLTSGLRQVCECKLVEVGQRGYDDLVDGLAAPSVTLPVALTPLPGTGALHLTLPAAFTALDHVLGGPGGPQPQRGFTDIEVAVLETLLDQVLHVLGQALEPAVVPQFALGAVEYTPQFLQLAGGTEPFVVVEFTLTVGAVSGPLLLALPVASLLPALDAQRPREAAPAAPGESATDRLRELPLPVSVRLDPVALSPAHVLDLAVGDVVPLTHRVGAPLTVHAGGTAYARAVAGRSGTRLAALVVDGEPPSPRTVPRTTRSTP